MRDLLRGRIPQLLRGSTDSRKGSRSRALGIANAAAPSAAARAAMALDADELMDLASTGDAGRFAPLLCRELALSKSHYHTLLVRLREERAVLQVLSCAAVHCSTAAVLLAGTASP